MSGQLVLLRRHFQWYARYTNPMKGIIEGRGSQEHACNQNEALNIARAKCLKDPVVGGVFKDLVVWEVAAPKNRIAVTSLHLGSDVLIESGEEQEAELKKKRKRQRAVARSIISCYGDKTKFESMSTLDDGKGIEELTPENAGQFFEDFEEPPTHLGRWSDEDWDWAWAQYEDTGRDVFH